jgi:hypothetical protein
MFCLLRDQDTETRQSSPHVCNPVTLQGFPCSMDQSGKGCKKFELPQYNLNTRGLQKINLLQASCPIAAGYIGKAWTADAIHRLSRLPIPTPPVNRCGGSGVHCCRRPGSPGGAGGRWYAHNGLHAHCRDGRSDCRRRGWDGRHAAHDCPDNRSARLR